MKFNNWLACAFVCIAILIVFLAGMSFGSWISARYLQTDCKCNAEVIQ
jgi:uncharacterized protein YneF (UPF0154 family)